MDPTLQLVINIGALCTALAAVVGLPVAVFKLWPMAKKAVAIGTVVETLPEMALELRALAVGQRSQADTLAELKDDVSKVKQQVKNDHSSNLREDLDGVRDNVLELHNKLDTHLAAPKAIINVRNEVQQP